MRDQLHTPPDAIQSPEEYPLEKAIFRVQFDVSQHFGSPNAHFTGRLDAVLLRSDTSDSSGVENFSPVEGGRDLLLDLDASCNSSVMHELILGMDSAIARMACPGDIIGLHVILGQGESAGPGDAVWDLGVWDVELVTIEIELRVRLGTTAIASQSDS